MTLNIKRVNIQNKSHIKTYSSKYLTSRQKCLWI